MERKIIAICGPTAVGKTEYAMETALRFSGEIISCDSMQLYKYMDVGSAKPTLEERAKVRHHLVDCVEPEGMFTVCDYQKMAKAAIEDVFSRGKTPVVSGGSGLYLESLLYDLDFSASPKGRDFREKIYEEAEKYGADYIFEKLKRVSPKAAERIHPNDIKRVARALEAAEAGKSIRDLSRDPVPTKDYGAKLVGLIRDRDELYGRINRRVDLLVEHGLFDEVESLLARGLTENDISMSGIGYKEIAGYFRGGYSKEEAVELVKKNTRRYAKRQLTWFRRYKEMVWFNISEFSSKENCLKEIFKWLEKD